MTEFAGGDTVHRVRRSIDQQREKRAIIGNDEAISYRQLGEASDRIATALIAGGVRVGDRVALAGERSPGLIAGMLGILKAGCAYVPLDSDMPRDRIRFVLWDSESRAVVGDPGGIASVRATTSLPSFPLDVDPHDDVPEFPVISQRAPAYIMYTSGTTGQPKGCVVTRANLAWLIEAAEATFDLRTDDVWSMAHSHCFDFSVWEVFGALTSGATLVVVPVADVRVPRKLLGSIRRHQVSVLSLTPGVFSTLLAVESQESSRLRSLRYVVLGGDRLEPATLTPWFERYSPEQPALVNMYGITETTVHVTHHKIHPAERPGVSSIGAPLPGAVVHLLDDRLRPVPTGHIGEICVGGRGVCDGYLNRPEESAARFVSDPFSPGARLYRSGDLGRSLPSGELEYVGRSDQQVKVKGYRVELGEIRAATVRHPGVRDAAAVLDPHSESLVVFCVPDDLNPGFVLDDLRSALPRYAVPRHVVPVDSFPLTGNGKIDRDALLARWRQTRQLSSVQDDEDPEIVLISAWSMARSAEVDPSTADFVADGGDSLDAASLVMHVADRGYQLSEADVLQLRTVPAIARTMTRLSQPPAAAGARPLPRTAERYPLTYFQRKYAALADRSYGGLAYPLLFDEVGASEVERAVSDVIGRHPILQSLAVGDERPFHEWRPAAPLEVQRHKLLGETCIEALIRLVNVERASLWDVRKSIPVRLRLLVDGRGRACGAVVGIHHIAVDEQSISTIHQELNDALLASELGEPESDFASYAVGEAALVADPPEDVMQFWRERTEKARSSLTGRPASSDVTLSRTASLSGSLLRDIRRAARSAGYTMAVFCTVLFFRSLFASLQRPEITVGLTLSTRTPAAGTGSVGPFINHAVLTLTREDAFSDKVFATLAGEVRAHQRNGRFPLGYFQQWHNGGRVTAPRQFFDYLVNFYPTRPEPKGPIIARSVRVPSRAGNMMRHVTLNVHESPHELRFELTGRGPLLLAMAEPSLTGTLERIATAAAVEIKDLSAPISQ